MVGRKMGSQPQVSSVHERAVSLAHRMVAGAGRASLVAYRIDGQPTLDAVAHGFCANGNLLVATTEFSGSHTGILVDPGARVQVRMDITKLSPEPRVEVLAASAHMLGQLEWLDAGRTAETLECDGVSETVRAVAQSPFGLLGVVRPAKVVLHDATGATVIPFSHLAQRHRDCSNVGGHAGLLAEIESTVLDVAASLDPVDLGSLCDAVSHGWVDARVLSEKPSAGGCAQTKNQDFLVDVDFTGLTVMRHGAERTYVFFVPFDRRVVERNGGLVAHIDSLFGARVGASD